MPRGTLEVEGIDDPKDIKYPTPVLTGEILDSLTYQGLRVLGLAHDDLSRKETWGTVELLPATVCHRP